MRKNMTRLLNLLLGIVTLVATFLVIIHWQPREHREGIREDHERTSDALAALEFWSQSRAYPFADIPADRYYKAYQYEKSKARSAKRSPLEVTPWEPIGPLNLQGRAISVAVNAQNSNTVYLGSASGGLWRSHTCGLGHDWQRITLGYPALGISAIVIDPADSNTIYIGTGEVYRYQVAITGLVIRTTRGSYGVGILKTTDGGATWTKSLDWLYNDQRGIQAIRMNPRNPNTLIAATTEGIYRTFDAGTSWEQIFIVPMGEDIIINSNDTSLVLISCGNFSSGGGLFRSTDEGTTWQAVPGAVSSYSGKALLDVYRANPNTVYASTADSTSGETYLWRSTDFGLTWTVLNSDPVAGVQGWYSHFVAVHPTDSSQIVHAGVSIFKSTNGGSNFSSRPGSYYDHHGFAVDPNNPDVLYIVNDDGIYRSTNFGGNYTSVGLGLLTGQLYNGASCSATDSSIMLVQSQDHIPGYLYTGSLTWQISAADEVGWTAIDQTNDNIMYSEYRFGEYIQKSYDRGLSWTGGYGFSGTGAWNSPFVLSPSSPNVLYFGDQRIYKTTSGGSGWYATNGGHVLDGNPALSMAVAATNPDTAFVGMAPRTTSMHVFRTTNGGSTWTNVTGILPDRYPLDIAIDPHNSAVVYITFGGFDAGHVFKSTNAGLNWSDISGALPPIPTGAILVDPLSSNFLYVGNDIGVYASTDGGSTWNSFNEGLPEAVLVADLNYTPSNRTLRIATHGNGAYQRKLPLTFPALVLSAPRGGENWKVGTTQVISWSSALVQAKRLEYTTDNGESWISIADSISPISTSYHWVVPPTLTEQAKVRVTSLADTGLRSMNGGTFTIFIHGIMVSADNGWNLVSLPLRVTDARKSVIFPTAITPLFSYNAGYEMKDTLANGVGYWLKLPAQQTVPMHGDTVGLDSIHVNAGWNLIGSITNQIPVSHISSVPSHIISSECYDYRHGYKIADTIMPGKGYWVKTNSSGALVLSSASDGYAYNRAAENVLDNMNTLTTTDMLGNSQRLFFGVSDGIDNMSQFDTPPRPPVNIFDVRFASNSMVEIVKPGQMRELPVEVLFAFPPVTVTWNIIDNAHYAILDDAGGRREIRGAGSTIFNELHSGEFVISAQHTGSGRRPAEFVLRQNYPNPFNPTTSISYDVPEKSFVSLKIFDVVGRGIMTLTAREQEAGSYTVQADFSNNASGIYICRLQAGSFTGERKLLLIK